MHGSSQPIIMQSQPPARPILCSVQARGKLGRNVAEAVWEVMQGWSRWAVGLQWLLAAAEAAGLHAHGEAYCCHSLAKPMPLQPVRKLV